MIALLVALGGTAYGVKTVKHYPEFNGVDIIDHSLSGVDIKNASVGPGIFNSRARKALKGNVGPAGPQGPQGAPGVAGAQGPAGPVKLVYVGAGFNNPAHTQSSGTASCPSGGYYAVGGGVISESATPGEQQVNSSFPLPSSSTSFIATSWKAYVDNTSASAYAFSVYVICAQPSSVAGKAAGGAAVAKH